MTAENFQACLAFTLKYEGGRSDDPRDPGGRTMEGVTQETYDRYRALKALGRKDVFMMDTAERDEIYRNEYWDRVNGDGLRAGEDLCVFDFAVNSGVGRALNVWSSIGHERVSDVIGGVCARRLSFLHALRTWSHFGAGWGRRVAACEARALRMAYGTFSAPAILASKAAEASHTSGKKTSQAAVAASASATAVAIAAGHMQMGSMAEAAMFAVIAAMAGILLFHSWRQGQRAAAFVTEAKR